MDSEVPIWFSKFCGIVYNASFLVWSWSRQHPPVSSLNRHRLMMMDLYSFWRFGFSIECLKNKYRIVFISCSSRVITPTSYYFDLLYFPLRGQFWFFWVTFMSLPLKQCLLPIAVCSSNQVRSEMKKILRKSILEDKISIDRSCVSVLNTGN